MAIQQDTVSIDLAQGVNNKVDDKIAGPEQTSVLTDARFDKDKRLVKRNGLTTQSQTFQGDPGFINSVSFNVGSLKAAGFVHGNQICLENNGNLFAQYGSQDKWIFKGTYVPIEIDVSRLDSNVQFTDTVTVGSVTVSAGGAYIYVSEESTGTIISKTQLTGTEVALRLIGFNSAAYVLTASSGSTLFARPVALTSGLIGSQITVTGQYVGYNHPPNITTTSSASPIGEAAMILYTSSSGSGAKARVVPFLSSGTVSSLGQMILGSVNAVYSNILIDPKVNSNMFYVSSQQPEIAQAWTFGSTDYTNAWSQAYTANSTTVFVTQPHSSTMAVSPVNNRDLFVYNDYYPSPTFNLPNTATYSDDNYVTMVRFGSAGALLSNVIYGLGYFITGNAFRDSYRKTIYLPVVYVSPLQKTVFLLDTLEGRNGFNYVMGKVLYGLADTNVNPRLGVQTSYPLSQTLPTSPDGSIYRLINNSYFVDFNLTPKNSPQTQYFANTTHATGGLLWAYDGDTMAEHNFFLAPEQTSLWIGKTGVVQGNQVTGGSTTAEQFIWTFGPAASIIVGATNANYLAFDAAGGGFYVWFTVDGNGVNPAIGGRTPIEVDLLTGDTPEEVAYKVKTQVNISSTGYVAVWPTPITQSPSNATVQMTSSLQAVVAAPSINGMTQNGNLGAGTYQFCALWRWTDKNGNVYRSAPSVPQSAVSTGSQFALLNVWAPPITNKNITSVIIEFYGTEANGTTFHLVSSTQTWSQTIVRHPVADFLNDTSVSSRSLLYTTGDVLENYGIGACKSVASFKERLQVTGIADDKYAIYYSKQVVAGEPVNFAGELFYRVDADLDPAIATKQLDDKSCVLKENLVYIISGDGANDLGEGSSFSPPLVVASDAGTLIPNSIVTYPGGMIFKSSKGYYRLDRALGVDYIGAPVEDLNNFKTSDAVLMKNQTEIRFTHADTTTAAVYNYFFDRWDFFSNYKADSAAIYNGDIVLIRNSGKCAIENDVFYDVDVSSQSYSVYVETPWLKLKGIQDYQRIYALEILGEYKTPHQFTVNVSYDYDMLSGNSSNYVFDATTIVGNASTAQGGQVYQFQVNLDRQKCESIKIKMTEIPDTGTASSSQASLYLNNLSAVVGLKKGLYKLPANKQA